MMSENLDNEMDSVLEMVEDASKAFGMYLLSVNESSRVIFSQRDAVLLNTEIKYGEYSFNPLSSIFCLPYYYKLFKYTLDCLKELLDSKYLSVDAEDYLTKYIKFADEFIDNYEFVCIANSQFAKEIFLDKDDIISLNYFDGKFEAEDLESISSNLQVITEKYVDKFGDYYYSNEIICIDSVSKLFDSVVLDSDLERQISHTKYIESQCILYAFRTRSFFFSLENDILNEADKLAFFDGIDFLREYRNCINKLKVILLNGLEKNQYSGEQEEEYRSILKYLGSNTRYLEYEKLFSSEIYFISESMSAAFGRAPEFYKEKLESCFFSKELTSFVKEEWLQIFEMVKGVKTVNYALDENFGLKFVEIDERTTQLVESRSLDVQEHTENLPVEMKDSDSAIGKAMSKLFSSESGGVASKLKEAGFQLTANALQNDGNIEKVAIFIHGLLPAVVRWAISYETVKKFLLDNRQWLINKLV